MKQAIFAEIYLDYYNKWGKGRYFSGDRIILIKDMNPYHLKGAIAALTLKRNNRIIKLDELSDSHVDELKEHYDNGEDLLELKIRELTEELHSRKDK